MKSLFYEDYEIGDERSSVGRTITEADIVLHAGQTGDFYPHHMDAHWCESQSFGQRIAHGTLVFSVAVGLTAGDVNPEAFSYGYDKLRFIRPVYIGDTLYTKVCVKEKRLDERRPHHGMVVERCETTNQRGELVLVSEHILMVKKRDAAAS